MSLAAGSPAGDLSGGEASAAIEGVATFSSLSINAGGTGFRLEAVAAGVDAVISDLFDVSAGSLSFDDVSPFGFGSVTAGNTASHVFNVTYSGGANLTSVAASLGSGVNFSIASNGCSGTISLDCSISVEFSPVSGGSKSDILTLSYNDGTGLKSVVMNVNGLGLSPANLTFDDGAAHDFGSLVIGNTTNRDFNVTYSGSVSATSVSSSLLGTDASQFSIMSATCSGTLSSNCDVRVSFAPTTSGSKTATLRLSFHNGSSNQTRDISLIGNGITPADLSFNDGTSYSFGDRAVGYTTTFDRFLTHSGGVDATSVSVSLSATSQFSLISSTCSGTVDSSGCNARVRFQPSSSGTKTATLTLNYYDGNTTQTKTLTLNGVGRDPALLTFGDGSPYGYGNVVVGNNQSHTFSVTKSGYFSATSVSASLSTGSQFSITSTTCSGTVSSSCSVTVRFSPTSSGSKSDTLTLSYYNGGGSTSRSISLSGSGLNPANLAFNDGAAHDFGSLVVGNTTNRDFNVTYSGSVSATSVSSSLSGTHANQFSIMSATCSGTVSSNCNIRVSFTPTTSGSKTATLNLSFHNGASTQTRSISLSGTGLNPSNLTFNDGASHDFGSLVVGNTTNRDFNVTYSGSVSATSVSSSLSGTHANQFSIMSATCSGTVSSNCNIRVSFTPTTSGSKTATLNLSFDNGVSTQTRSISLSGTGLNPANLTFNDGASHDFGSLVVGNTTNRYFNVTYSGDVSATSVSSSLSGTHANQFSIMSVTCSGTVSSNCNIRVSFTPTTSGSKTATLNLSFHNGASTQTRSISLSGTGLNPANLTFNDGASHNFGSLVIGNTTDRFFNVTYSGSVSATSVASSLTGTNANQFSIMSATCSGTVSSNCNIRVSFTPTLAGPVNATLRLSFHNGVSTQTRDISLSGTGLNPANLTFNDGASHNFGSLVVGNTTDRYFNVTYSGSVSATSVSSSLSGTNANQFSIMSVTCSGTVSSNCNIRVSFTPTTSGSKTATLNLSFHNGLSTQTRSISLSGTGLNPANLTFNDGASYVFTNTVVGESSWYVPHVFYSGEVNATSVSTSLSGTNANQFSSPDTTCSGSVYFNCTVWLSFSPTSTGLKTATLSLSFHNGVSTQTRTLSISGTGFTPANLTFNDGASHNFGSIYVGNTTNRFFNVTYSGSVSATSVSSSLSGTSANQFSIMSATCSGTVSSNCNIRVSFTPTTSGSKTATLNLSFHNGVSTQTRTISLSGTGLNASDLRWEDGGNYSYGTTNTNITRTFVLRNHGSSGTVSQPISITLSGNGFAMSSNNCSNATLAYWATCSVSVTFQAGVNGRNAGNYLAEVAASDLLSSKSLWLGGTAAFSWTPSTEHWPHNTYESGVSLGASCNQKSTTNVRGLVAEAPYGTWVRYKKVSNTCSSPQVRYDSDVVGRCSLTGGWTPMPNPHCQPGDFGTTFTTSCNTSLIYVTRFFQCQ
jgi:hypothetical protein